MNIKKCYFLMSLSLLLGILCIFVLFYFFLQIIDWLTNPKQSHISGFFQWKPVSYISLPRGRNTATKVEHSDLKNVDKSSSSAKLLNNTVLLAVFNESLWNGKTVKRMANISFGLPKDGFYIKNNYTAW